MAALVAPRAAAAVPTTQVGIHKKVLYGNGHPLSGWTVGHNGTFSITITNTGATFPLFDGKYVVHEHVPAGLTVTSIGGSGATGSWSCTPAVPQTGPVTITCSFSLENPGGVPVIQPGGTLPPIIVGVHVDGPSESATGGYENCATLETTASDIDAPNPSCVTTKPLVFVAGSGVCVEKFLDHDADGRQDAADPLLSGARFVLRNTGRNRVLGKLVSSASEISCLGAKPGRYVLSERPRQGWEPTRPPGGARAIRLWPGKPTLVTFGNRPDSQLCVRKFEDLDRDGVLDPDEPDLPNWVFLAVGSEDSLNLYTGSPRTCAWVPPGTYTVSEVPQDGWTSTAPPSGVQTIEVEPATSSLATFGNARESCCLPFTYLGGKKDEFSLNGPAEPADPITPSTTQLFFDQTDMNMGFEHRINVGVGNCIADAKLAIRMRALGDVSYNDDLTLKVPTGQTKQYQISDLTGLDWVSSDPAQTVTLDLAALPDVLSSLDSIRRLDVLVQDDTSIDFIELEVGFCECNLLLRDDTGAMQE